MPFRQPFRAVPICEDNAHRSRRHRRATRTLVRQCIRWGAIAAVLGVATGYLISTGTDGRPRWAALLSTISANTAKATRPAESSVYYASCDQAHAAGASSVYAGEPGYRRELDADGDGIACEPYPR
jgi:hypothetical protein